MKKNQKIAYKDRWDHPSNLVKNLIPCNAYDFKVWADMAIEFARGDHRKIPYDEIGKAICKKIDGKNYEYIARFFMNDERVK